MDVIQKVKEFLIPNDKAYTAILVGSVMTILIGSVMLVVTYIVLNAIGNAAGNLSNSLLNTSMQGQVTVVTQALQIVGIGLIVAGVAGIIYMLMGVAGMTGRGR